MHLSRATSWMSALVLAAVPLVLPQPAWAAPTCDPSLQLESVHPGSATWGSLSCDDPSGTGLNYSITAGPYGGYATADGSAVSYYPYADYVGSDSFTVEVTDNEGGSTTVEVMVEVTDSAPECADHVSASPHRAPVDVDLEEQCWDLDGDQVTFAIVGEPQHGTVTLDPQGVATYTPDADYTGIDSFSYQASDLWLTGTTAAVNVRVALPDPLEASLIVPRQTLRSAAADGLRVVATPSRSAHCDITLTVSRKTARRLGIAPKATGPVVVGARTADASGRTTLRVPLTGKAARAFKKTARAEVLGSLRATDPIDTATATARATLTNP